MRRGWIVGVRVARLVRTGTVGLLPGIRYLLRAVHRRWRRSLQFRTVLTTLLLAIGSFAVVGAYLSNQIANNLFQERLAQAESETRYNVKQVQDTFDGAQVTDQSSVITLVYDTLNAVEGRGSVIQRRYVFEAMPEQTKPRNRWVESRASDQLTISVIPPELRKAVQDSGKDQFWASTEFPVGTEDRPGIAVGNKVTFNGTVYELYLIYDLNTAQKTLNEIQNVLLRRRRGAVADDRRRGLVRHPQRRESGQPRGPGLRKARRGPAAGAHGGQGRGRGGPARGVVQPHGGKPSGTDHAAGHPVADAAAVRLRRLP